METIQETKETSVEDLFDDVQFRENLRQAVNEIDTKIANLCSAGKRLKRNPVYRLEDSGKWNVNGLIKVYSEYYIDKSVHHPQAVREFVLSMIVYAAKKTIIKRKNKEAEVLQNSK